MATLKTPGVYVEEISKFPPSVAAVNTAIPAFIGYTEKAEKRNGDSLKLIPTRISSMLEYTSFFGLAEEEDSITVEVNVDSNDNEKIIVNNSTPSAYKMYYSMQMYFANGGGPCYIVSVGDYGDSIVLDDSIQGLNYGLTAIRREDEPTLILFPDATSLGSDSDFYAIYNSALAQCVDLQDRFTIIDTYTCVDVEDDMVDFRNGIRSEKDYVKYGATYYPYLDTILDYYYKDTAVMVTDNSSLSSVAQITALGAEIYSLTPQLGVLMGNLVAKRNALRNFVDPANYLDPFPSVDRTELEGILQQIINHLSTTLSKFNAILAIAQEETTPPALVAATNALDAWISANLEVPIAEINAQQDKLAIDDNYEKVLKTIGSSTSNTYKSLGIATVAYSADGSGTDYTLSPLYITLNTNPTPEISAVIVAYPPAPSPTVTLAALETTNNPLYNRVKQAIAAIPITLPPSSAIAGVYARVDGNVGVWKAPANVNVSYIMKPALQISMEEQADMNVTSSGKSVNAIRTFTGKGTLVWGARTLAGNDNEWRYISVRRFFNFVEESVSEASEQFVFESNDANTWIRVRAMIENFLNLQWKAGALAGSKPEEAYYVRIGLGSTMTAQDILEGRMIVEIGMAAVRPAEFIVLRFSHKMQES